MKLRNKKTGEIREAADVIIENLKKNGSTLNAISIDEIRNEWEDYKEPKGVYVVTGFGSTIEFVKTDLTSRLGYKEIGNYFETKEEAEKAVEKLKAWKRLKDNGYEFNGIGVNYDGYKIYLKCDIMKKEHYTPAQDHKDLDLLFGGEE